MEIRRYKPFRILDQDIKLKNKLRNKYITANSLRNTKIDIILPTYNRFELLNKAIESVKKQLHKRWTLYICDDGSTDETSQIYGGNAYIKDSRIKYINLEHKGVSAARNYGLKNGSSTIISFLDSDNTWSPEYLSLMLTFMKEFSLDSAYCAARLIGDTSEEWLGDYFNWEACANKNYIDMNCFMLKRTHHEFLFDENLKRFVDWDFILEATKESRTSYLPLPLVNYCNKQSRDRITTSEYQGVEYREWIKNIQRKHGVDGKNNNLDFRIASFVSHYQ